MARDIAALISAIPTAQEGQVIGQNYHNSLKAAVEALSERLGAGTGELGGRFVFAPIFMSTREGANWLLLDGYATKPIAYDADGWLVLQLPNGSRINRLTILGEMIGGNLGTDGALLFQLQRQALAERSATLLIQTSVPINRGVFRQPGEAIPGTPGAAMVVDSGGYKYLVKSQLFGTTNPSGDALVNIYSILVDCGTP